jgi:LPXTG-site transpeptidase (sortase) family protein
MGQIRRAGTTWRLQDVGTALLFLGLILLVVTASMGTLLSATAPPTPPLAPIPTVASPSPGPTATATAPIARPEDNPQPTAVPPRPPTRLLLPALGLDAPVMELPIEDKTWDMSGLTDEIAHLGGTANPGEQGNMVLAGHVTLRIGAGPFLHLESLKEGDEAIVYAGDEAYTYRVVTKKHVPPDDVSVAYPTSAPMLTMLTCTSWDAQNRRYSERVAVIARLVQEKIYDWTHSRISPESY